MWIPAFRWSTSCSVDLSLFPLDKQVCSVIFMAWLNPMTNDMAFIRHPDLVAESSTGTKQALTGIYSPNEQWELTDSHIWHFYGLVATGTNNQVTKIAILAFSVSLSRQPRYYVLNILLPTVILTLVSMFVFFLPIESGEKVSFSITMLLSYTLLLVMINDITPKGGPMVPLMCKPLTKWCMPLMYIIILSAYYLVVGMCMCAVSMMATFCILRVYNHSGNTPVPTWAQRLFFCQCSTSSTQVEDMAISASTKDLKKAEGQNADDRIADENHKADWEALAKRLDTTGFITFLIIFILMTFGMLLYIGSCGYGSESCSTVSKSIFYDENRFQ